jgi:hypothetical protein
MSSRLEELEEEFRRMGLGTEEERRQFAPPRKETDPTVNADDESFVYLSDTATALKEAPLAKLERHSSRDK